MNSIESLLSLLPAAYQADKAGDLEADVQLHFEGEGGGDWTVRFHDGQVSVEPGTVSGARLTLGANTEDFFKLVNGEMNPMLALAQGKIRVEGDVGLAMKLMNYFEVPD